MMHRLSLLAAFAWLNAPIVPAQNVIVDAAPSQVANSFSPIQALGAGVDRIRVGLADKALRDPMLKEILSIGWQPVSYRQNTELHIEAWHWNPNGTWSDPSGKGYFTGNATPGNDPINHSWGFALPHKGTTNRGGGGGNFSRLTDGDPATYWKSNPYLTHTFTGDDDSANPQWVMLDLGSMQKVNAIRIAWVDPYATSYTVQFWTAGEDNPRRAAVRGIWQTFQNGIVTAGKGGTATIALTNVPVAARFLRVFMTASSNTCDSHGSADRRNCVGYAIGELSAGVLAKDGTFTDLVKHAAGAGQTSTVCSSVDPWHEPSNENQQGGDQVGLDFFYTSGITRGLPAMIPVAMLYGTPEDAAAEIAYVEKRGYPISWVELGEEPDGKQAQPEDIAALYVQFAAAIHKVDPKLKLGGPVFEGVNEDIQTWPLPDGRVSWLGRFIDYLKAHGKLGELGFMSFEHYPYPCRSQWSDLYREPELISHIMDVWRNDGVPPNVPLIMSEGNLAAQAGGNFLDVMGALWLADYQGSFLASGGAVSYFFHYIPEPTGRGCDEAGGTFGVINVDRDYKMHGYLSQYFASRLITREWVQPVDQQHKVFRAASDVKDANGNVLVTSYAVLRPDGQWSLMLVNRDHDNPHPVHIAFQDGGSPGTHHFSGPVQLVTFGAAQYVWHAKGAESYADPDGPPARSTLTGNATTVYELPKASITVIRGKIGGE